MTVQQQAIRPSGIREAALGLALATTFAAGLLTGIVAPGLARQAPSRTATASTASSRTPSLESAYQTYRTDERGDATSAVGSWLAYRAGERGDQ